MKLSTPNIDWQNIHYINMGKGTLLGTTNNSNETWKLTVKNTNLTAIEFTKERFDYPGSSREYPSLVNVKDKFAYVIAGSYLTSCLRFDVDSNTWENIPDIKAPGR